MNVPKIELTASNTTKVFLPSLTMFFSYETCVGFRSNEHGYVFTATAYSNTTAKHLTAFGSEKADRVPQAEFDVKLQEALKATFTGTD